MSACEHSSLGKPPRGHRIAFCDDCGAVFYGYEGKWETSNMPAVDPASADGDFFDNLVRHVGRRVPPPSFTDDERRELRKQKRGP